MEEKVKRYRGIESEMLEILRISDKEKGKERIKEEVDRYVRSYANEQLEATA